MGFFKRDPIEAEIIRLERSLTYAETDEERDAIKDRLEKMYEIDSKKRSNQLHVTGDGLLKCGTVIGLALVGYFVEKNGGIIPRWAQTKF